MNDVYAALIGGDWVAAIEQAAATTTDPVERAELDRELDQALAILEKVERSIARSKRIDNTLEAEEILRQPLCLRRFLSPRQKAVLIRHFGSGARYQREVPW